MNELTLSEPCVLFALSRESMSFRREFPPQQRFPGAPCRAHFCGPAWLTLVVLETGVGPRATEQAVTWVLGRPMFGDVAYCPKVVLCAGFSGALRPGRRVGDLVLATEVADTDGGVWPATWPGELTGEWRPPLERGRILTAPALVSSPQEKRRLGEQHQAVAVDMESAVVARLCSQQGVPFGCLRAISDEVDTALSPRLVHVLSGGGVSWPRLVGNVVRSPRLVGELWRLAGQTRSAARQLAAALGEVLTLTLPWMAEER
jgi:nucleoside phosphorylase